MYAIINTIQERFDHDSFKVFSSIEFVLLKHVNQPEEEDQVNESFISNLYGDDIIESKQMFYDRLSKRKLLVSKTPIRK